MTAASVAQFDAAGSFSILHSVNTLQNIIKFEINSLSLGTNQLSNDGLGYEHEAEPHVIFCLTLINKHEPNTTT